MRVIFLGPQGSGKSTQAKMVADELGFPYIEMGQMLRDKAQEKSDLGESIKKSLGAGELVTDNIAVDVLNNTLNDLKFSHGFVLDGYPRNQAQLDGFKYSPDKVFYVKVSDQEAIKRLTLRARADDTKEALLRRLEIYHEKTEPLLKKYKNAGILTKINGEKSIDDVRQEIKSYFKNE